MNKNVYELRCNAVGSIRDYRKGLIDKKQCEEECKPFIEAFNKLAKEKCPKGMRPQKANFNYILKVL